MMIFRGLASRKPNDVTSFDVSAGSIVQIDPLVLKPREFEKKNVNNKKDKKINTTASRLIITNS